MPAGFMIGFFFSRNRRRAQGRERVPECSPAVAKPVLPPVETPAGAPGLGFLIAYEDPEAWEGWSFGVVREIEEGCEGREFTVDSRMGRFRVSRSSVFYWWAPGALLEPGAADLP